MNRSVRGTNGCLFCLPIVDGRDGRIVCYRSHSFSYSLDGGCLFNFLSAGYPSNYRLDAEQFWSSDEQQVCVCLRILANSGVSTRIIMSIDGKRIIRSRYDAALSRGPRLSGLVRWSTCDRSQIHRYNFEVQIKSRQKLHYSCNFTPDARACEALQNILLLGVLGLIFYRCR